MDSEHRQIHILMILALLLSCAVVGLSILDSPNYHTPIFIYSDSKSQSSSYSSSLPSDSSTSKSDGAIININSATLEELQLLPGVGPSIAQNILDYRNSIGKFTSVDELLNVNRIGQKTLDKLRPYISLE